MIKENKKTKRNVLIMVIGLILVVAIATLSYALWTRNFTETGVNKNIYDCFEISYQETKGEGVTLEHGYPQPDEEGLQNNPYEITIKNTCKTIASYDVILNKEKSSTLEDQYLKVAVGDNYKKLSEYKTTTTKQISGFNNAASYIIGTGVLSPNSTKIIDIRSWMDNATTETQGENKSFAFKITIEATAGDGGLLAGKILKSYSITPEEEMINGYDFYSYTKYNQEVNIKIDSEYFMDNVDYEQCVNYQGNFAPSEHCIAGVTDPSEYINWYTFANDDYFTSGGPLYKVLEANNTTILKADEIYFDGYDVEEGIVATPDDNGTSYVLRGKINNNYVEFAGQDWRIVRINGDGTIRLMLKNKLETNPIFNANVNDSKYVGYTYDNDIICTKEHPCKSTYTGSKIFDNSNGGINSDMKTYLEDWYNTNLKDKDNQIAYGTYCNDTTISSTDNMYTYYGPYERIVDNIGASLQCPDTEQNYGGIYKLKIGLLTVDEMNIAGLPFYYEITSDYYMYHNYNWWTMSPYDVDNSCAVEFLGDTGYIDYSDVNHTGYAAHPVINLSSDVQITGGNGTESNPYIVD